LFFFAGVVLFHDLPGVKLAEEVIFPFILEYWSIFSPNSSQVAVNKANPSADSIEVSCTLIKVSCQHFYDATVSSKRER
jgi:hypothetical protein